jgi:hypothetical protein
VNAAGWAAAIVAVVGVFALVMVIRSNREPRP